eukprot:gnl/TRDRNA2_/TRDRNA2_159001_c1_seq1.p3 gnl/TRDRNA2_/TRDRNA2_159001_c1~~gnl/TRDRNA2_/TRDRNA2_159001_c1_seq1.p3  ORF type:complete len:140 (-),score=35.77 gnl/TRDRNA2_/TRDRNA2_159001_c1_seq1:4-423(-)
MAELKHVELAEEPGGIAIIRLARPDFMNALNLDTVREMRRALQLVAEDPKARVLVIAGKGPGFCAGADLSDKNFMRTGEKKPKTDGEKREKPDIMTTEWNPMMQTLGRFPKPTISVVHGPAAGGGVGVALATDVIWELM